MVDPRTRQDSPAGLDGGAAEALLRTGRFFTRRETSPDLRAVYHRGGREGDVFYRDRWSHDKVVRSTHGVNCTGSCSWKVYVKDGIITWESQQTDYASVGRTRRNTSRAVAPAVPPSRGTPIPPPECAFPTRAASWSRCTGRRRRA